MRAANRQTPPSDGACVVFPLLVFSPHCLTLAEVSMIFEREIDWDYSGTAILRPLDADSTTVTGVRECQLCLRVRRAAALGDGLAAAPNTRAKILSTFFSWRDKSKARSIFLPGILPAISLSSSTS